MAFFSKSSFFHKVFITHNIRLFSNVKQPTLSQLYLDLKEGKYNDDNPIDIMQNYQSKLDILSFDILFERALKPDWGKKKIRNPLDLS